MARARKMFLAGLLIFLLGGCANPSWAGAGKIIPPLSRVSPVEGKWIIKQDLNTGRKEAGTAQNWIGKTAQFAGGVATLGDYVWHNPTYKIKKVNSTDYLMSKYLNLSSSLVPSGKEVNVVTVSSAENFLVELMEIDSSHAIAFIQNQALYLQKVSDQVDPSLVAAAAEQGAKAPEQSSPRSSGVLLGLRTPLESAAKGTSGPDYAYRTLWIASSASGLHPVLQNKDIFFPRRSGFWQLKVRRVEEGSKAEDLFLAYDVSTQDPEKHPLALNPAQWQNKQGTLTRRIDYVGNDYVAVTNDGQGKQIDDGQIWTDHDLEVLPVDKISSPVGIKLSDLVGNSGLQDYRTARAQASKVLNNQGLSKVGEDELEQDFGLTRRNGHWYLQGRINYRDGDKPGYLDFNINLIPPAKLIFYDTLYLSWQNIKDRVPDAVDAFTSPNQDLALVQTKTTLYVYAIRAGQLSSNPLDRITLQAGETAVMAEWATGVYVENWEKAFIADGAQALK